MEVGKKKKKKKMLWLTIFIVIVLIISGYLFSSGSGLEPVDKNLLIQPARSDISVTVTETGIVEPSTKVEIKSKIPGQVAVIFVDEGDIVKEGQTLLELDKTDYQHRVARARALAKEARIKLDYYHKKVARKKKEFQSRGISQSELDEVELERELAEVSLEKQMIDLKAAEDDFTHCTVKAPLAGVVIFRGVEIGEMVTPGIDATVEGKPLLTVADLSQLLIKAELNQIDMSQVKLAQDVLVRFDAIPGASFAGKVHRISPAAETGRNNINLFPIEILLDHQEDEGIKPGMTADIEILITRKKDVLNLPVESVRQDGKKRYVFLFRGTPEKYTLTEQTVTTGIENDRIIEIIDGITAEEQVYIQPASSEANEMVL